MYLFIVIIIFFYFNPTVTGNSAIYFINTRLLKKLACLAYHITFLIKTNISKTKFCITYL